MQLAATAPKKGAKPLCRYRDGSFHMLGIWLILFTKYP